MAAEQLGGVGCAATARQNGKLSAGRGHGTGRTGIARSDNVDIASGNDTDGIRQGDIADKIIDDAIFFGRRFRRLIAIGSELAKDLVQAWPAQIAVDEQNTMTLLSERKGIVGAGETLPLVRQSTREKENFSFR